jgi:hypothetical protein
MGRTHDGDDIWIDVESVVEWTMQNLTNQDDPVANRRLVRAILLGQDRWLRPGEAAKALGVTVRRLRELVTAGVVQALWLEWAVPSDRLRIPESAVRGGRGVVN